MEGEKMNEYKPTIGLEIHIQLDTKTKLFCGCSSQFGEKPNTHICPVCLGLPGALPVLNEKAVEYGIKLGLTLNMKINKESTFYRKNYFYPDLPKGYQITQYTIPIASEGFLEIKTEKGKRKISIQRGHIEEDSGKSIHTGDITESTYSYIDFNRSGVPLMEIVTYPDIETAEEAYHFLVLLRKTVRYLGVSSGDMEKGALRCDVNVSLSKSNTMGTKVEIKNLNSFRSIRKALEYEIKRQTEMLKNGEKTIHETRHFDEKTGATKPMRTKEELNDYRYFPEPDLPPLLLNETFIEDIKNSLPELPVQKEERFIRQYSLSDAYAYEIASSIELADYFESIAKATGKPKEVANFLMGSIMKFLNETEKTISEIDFDEKKFIEFLSLLEKGIISKGIAKEVIVESLKTGKSPKKIVEDKGLIQITDENKIEEIVQQVLKENPEAVSRYLAGKTQVLGFLAGQVMKKTKGKANPQIANKLLTEALNKIKQ
jgi:aspartyl-tRNA(Asn)/glutamyl-tRNA(Gln) amidotransferase subunit B